MTFSFLQDQLILKTQFKNQPLKFIDNNDIIIFSGVFFNHILHFDVDGVLVKKEVEKVSTGRIVSTNYIKYEVFSDSNVNIHENTVSSLYETNTFNTYIDGILRAENNKVKSEKYLGINDTKKIKQIIQNLLGDSS